MRHDNELLRWYLPSTFVAMMLAWQATPAGHKSASSAVAFVAGALEGLGYLLLEVLARVAQLDILPAIPDAVARWLIPLMIATMILVSLINALYQEKLTRVEQTVNSDRMRR